MKQFDKNETEEGHKFDKNETEEELKFDKNLKLKKNMKHETEDKEKAEIDK